jgi:hypothetical protein
MPHVGALQGAVLGLLPLLLGFTFAMAVQRFETRKSLVLEESNAIGTASLRAQFLPVAQQQLSPRPCKFRGNSGPCRGASVAEPRGAGSE